ncbi:MAG: hypothetical protein ABEI99_05200, partial [Halobaculum sp.]
GTATDLPETAYAAPEQRDDSQFDRVGERTDVYQLGVVTYELVTGGPPNDGRHWTTPDDGQRVPEVSVGYGLSDADELLTDLLRTAMELDPADRYTSAASFRSDLETVLRRVAEY